MHGTAISKTSIRGLITAIALVSLSACSAVGPHNVKTAVTAPSQDSYVGVNKAIHDFNKGFDQVIFRPISKGYKAVTPKPVRKGFSNFLSNLFEPWTAINEVLQLNFKGAFHTTKRFVVNSTMGLGGIVDTASKNGIDRHKEDFGQTLAIWGIKPGPYVVIPFIGPSNLRDTVGFGVDFFVEPLNVVLHNKGRHLEAYGRTLATALDARTRNYDALTDYIDRPDSYPHLKLFYEQTRAYQIRNGLTAPDAVDDMFVGEDEPDCYPADEAIEGDVICED